ncbi:MULTISPECIES: DUF2865 domain-containing protein [unclassified Devosia]|uniref:DUF2865 domain-containing protein n=1 Tax=unclassified Devosia TaxID=196773 RepID=UPI001AD2343F|nr:MULTISPECIES: DUF2865 domain-containing protein [unclassified Devosia]MBN9305723.1 DUF2865 domain-containing protein [Devosia sp.]
MAVAKTLLLRLALLIVALTMFGLDANAAFAQSRNCQALANTLQQIERNGGFSGLGDINDRVRAAQDAVTATESRYVRDGCNAAAKAGQQLNAQCRAEARAVLSARADLKKISSQADTGNAVSQQREAILQEMARFNCNSRTASAPQQRGSLFDQLFGAFEDNFGDGVATRGDEFSGQQGYETIRTVCVRKVDGYYWPISYSTLIDYAQNDLLECQAQCPGMDVDLYYYDNPGQEPDQMINLQGVPYKSLPTAFAYRTSYDPNNTCKPKVDYGSINLAALPDGSSRAMISFDGQIFPLPIRDPRRPTDATVVDVARADYVDIPLPRPRPAAPGEAPKPVVVKQASNDPERIVMFGDKRVRIVGPDTPYAPTAAAGT